MELLSFYPADNNQVAHHPPLGFVGPTDRQYAQCPQSGPAPCLSGRGGDRRLAVLQVWEILTVTKGEKWVPGRESASLLESTNSWALLEAVSNQRDIVCMGCCRGLHAGVSSLSEITSQDSPGNTGPPVTFLARKQL